MANLILSILLLNFIACNQGPDIRPEGSIEPRPTHANILSKCFENGSGCSEIDMDSSNAEEAYQKGCSVGDYYSCYRLGQYFEFKSVNFGRALEFYQRACRAKDSYGCEGDYELHMKLCYEKESKEYCNKREPQGEYRIIAFLENLDPKYEDSLKDHNYSYDFRMERTQNLFNKRLKQKEVRLLRALEKAKEGKYYDGDSSETLNGYLKILSGGEIQKGGI